MPKQQQPGVPDWRSALLSEISSGTSRQESRDGTEAEIARLSADPLLLHRYLQEFGGFREQWKPDSQWKVFSGLKTGPEVSVSRTSGERRPYHVVEPRIAESLQPESYVATEEDIAMAIEHGAPSPRGAVANPQQSWNSIAAQQFGRRRLFLCGILITACLVGAMIW